MRSLDTAARYGGEEFVVILPECNAAAACLTAERLRQAVNEMPLRLAPWAAQVAAERVTISLGVALAPQHADTPAGLVHAADVALYAAKRDGKNRVKLFDGPALEPQFWPASDHGLSSSPRILNESTELDWLYLGGTLQHRSPAGAGWHVGRLSGLRSQPAPPGGDQVDPLAPFGRPRVYRAVRGEAAAVAQLRHPNIVQVFDFNHDADVYYMVMEYLPGESLQDRLKTLSAAEQRFPLTTTATIIGTVADAVAYAHERGTIHRDLKPANVMLMPQGQPVLTDFGVAKIIGGQRHTATGAVIGTPAYMSPEQVRGEHLDGRADIYSLGIMLYEMAAGRPPFEGDSAMTVMLKHINEPVPDIRKAVPDVPDGLVKIVEKALAKLPEQRFQSAAQLSAALRALAQNPNRPATVSGGAAWRDHDGDAGHVDGDTGHVDGDARDFAGNGRRSAAAA